MTMKESYLGDKNKQNQTGSQYKPLAMGSSILYYDHDKSQWVPGVLVEKIHDRSYVIISQKGRKVTRNRIDIKPYPGKVQVHFETPKVPMTSPTIMSKQASSSSSHRPFHHNNTFNANATSTPSSTTSSSKSSISLPKVQTQTLSSHHDRKSCSLKQRDPINNRDTFTAFTRHPASQTISQKCQFTGETGYYS